jgi:hypothetical protein
MRRDSMPKMICKCGEVLSYSEIPCKIEFKFISDLEYDKFQGEIDSEKLSEEAIEYKRID